MFLVCAAVLALCPGAVRAVPPQDRTVQASAVVQPSPPEISLRWPADPKATGYTVYRKASNQILWGDGTPLPGDATGYADDDVAVGTAYDYQIVKSAREGGSEYAGYGYVYAGIEVPLTEDRGTVILIVDATHAASLAPELARLREDLVGDGWTVLRHDVARSQSVSEVKALIQADYAADPRNVKAVFLFGHVPVPYSGNIAPDGHEDHEGAWPADVFYGDMDGEWTDEWVDTTIASRDANHNVPGDGKYDQSDFPSEIELQVGRVDLFDMPAFPADEEALLRQYLDKDHRFRHKRITALPRGLIDDNIGDFGGEAFAASGWRNFAPFFGPTEVHERDWFSTLDRESYLWAYGCGFAGYDNAGGIGSTWDFAAIDPRAVFTMLLGSYFGDWDVQNSFLRAPLATSTYGLTCSWAGRPHWFYHHMALGETIGHSARLTQNNGFSGVYQEPNYESRKVHVALMGDPTLRMHPVAPPSALTATATPSGDVELRWEDSPDTAEGYHVYRARTPAGPFARLSDSLVEGTRFTDEGAASETYTYMVRAVKRETTPSGSYYNGSQGVFATSGP